MGQIRSFRDLVAWQLAHALAVDAYRLVAGWPKADQFTIGAQIRRASGSVADNIAEGFGMGSRPAFLKHLRIARGSLCEFESQAERGVAVNCIPAAVPLLDRIEECRRVLQALITSLENSTSRPPEDRSSRS